MDEMWLGDLPLHGHAIKVESVPVLPGIAAAATIAAEAWAHELNALDPATREMVFDADARISASMERVILGTLTLD